MILRNQRDLPGKVLVIYQKGVPLSLKRGTPFSTKGYPFHPKGVPLLPQRGTPFAPKGYPFRLKGVPLSLQRGTPFLRKTRFDARFSLFENGGESVQEGKELSGGAFSGLWPPEGVLPPSSGAQFGEKLFLGPRASFIW